jgi:hypothetical protein
MISLRKEFKKMKEFKSQMKKTGQKILTIKNKI